MAPYNFVEEFKDMTLTCVPSANEDYVEDLGLGLLSSAMNVSYVENQMGPIYLKYWAMFIAGSGAYKTIPFNYCREIGESTNLTLQSMAGYENTDVLTPENFSAEGISEFLRKNPRGLMLYDEASMLFKQMADVRSHNYRKAEMLGMIYDGGQKKNYTISKKMNCLPKCWVSFLGCSTPYIYNFIDEEYFVQGLCNRILFREAEAKCSAPLSKSYWSPAASTARQKSIDDIGNHLTNLFMAAERVNITANKDAQTHLEYQRDKWNLESYKNSKEDKKNIRSGYLNRAFVHAVTVAGLHCISRQCDIVEAEAGTTNLITLILDRSDAEYGIDRVCDNLFNFDNILKEVTKTKESEKMTTDEDMMDTAVKHIIQVQVEGYFTRNKLWQTLRWIATDYRNKQYRGIMSSLCDKGIIERVENTGVPSHLVEKLGVSSQSIVYRVLKV